MVEAELVDHKHRTGGRGASVEHVSAVDDPVGVSRRPPRPRRLGASGDDDEIGPGGGNHAGIHPRVVVDLHAVAAGLDQLVAHQVAKLGAVGHARRQAHLPAGLRGPLVHRDPMSVAGGGDGRLQARGAGTGHEHALRGGT